MTGGDLIDQVLRPGELSVVFQPVVETALGRDDRAIHYLEALIRGPRGTCVESPDVLFEYARRKQRSLELDRACVAAVLAEAGRLPSHLRIGLNVHASTLALDPEFLNLLGDTASLHGIDPERLVVEIVEHARPWSASGLCCALEGMRDIGVRIAVDDVGLGYSNYRMILDCRPDYFKIDRSFVTGSRTDHYRKAVLRSVAQLARPFGAQVIAEGVETPEDLLSVHEAGIGLVQGFLFGRPQPRGGLGAQAMSS